MTIRPELLDELLKDYQTPQDLLGENGIIKQLTKAMIERCLQAEMQEHLGYPKHGRKKLESANTRNGAGQKTLKSEHGALEIAVPRDRDGSFEPLLVKKRQTRLEGFEEKILALYARGMTTRDIQAQLQELYGVEVSPTFISNVTEEVMEEVRQWQNRPLEALYPILYVDCLVVKVRENQRVINKAVYLALGVTMEGQKELLGMWMSVNEGAKFWLTVFTELHNRGMKDCFIACVDGLTGLPEAIETVFPQTQVQLCMVHLVRNSLRYVSYKHRKAVATDLKAIYSASTEAEAEFNLELFAEKWDQQYPTISTSWRTQWARVIPLFAFSGDIRKVIQVIWNTPHRSGILWLGPVRQRHTPAGRRRGRKRFETLRAGLLFGETLEQETEPCFVRLDTRFLPFMPLCSISTERSGRDDGRESKRAMGTVSSYQSAPFSSGMAPAPGQPTTQPTYGGSLRKGA